MASELSEPALSDFMASFLPQAHDPPNGLAGDHYSKAAAGPLHRSSQPQHTFLAGGILTGPAPVTTHFSEGQDFVQAQSFTDILASVAHDWQQPQEPQEAWGGSFLTGDGWNFDIPDGLCAAEPSPPKLTAPGDCSSNNSGDVMAPKQEDASSPAIERAASDPDSEGDVPTAPRAVSSSRQRDIAAGRDQRRTRKREKDRIDELQAAIESGLEVNKHLAAQRDELSRDLQAKAEELQKMRAVEESALPAADDDRLAASFEDGMRLTVNDGQEILLKPEELRSLHHDDLRRLWECYVQRLTALLQAQAQHGSHRQEAAERIKILQRELTLLHIRCAVVNTTAVKKLWMSSCLGQQRQQPGFWGKVAEALQLSLSQRGLMTELWLSISGRSSSLMQLREGINRNLLSTMPDAVFGRSFAVNFLKAHELMDALKCNLRQEHIALCNLAYNFQKILTPAQNARCIVASWPWLPDFSQIALSVARGMGEC